MRGNGSILIPGRRVSHGESFLTSWFTRGGDCMVVHAECLVASGGSVLITAETRPEPGGTITSPTPTYVPSGSVLTLSAVGLVTGYWRAGTTTSNGIGAQVRLKIAFSGTSGQYLVLRVFQPVFFDAARPYS